MIQFGCTFNAWYIVHIQYCRRGTVCKTEGTHISTFTTDPQSLRGSHRYIMNESRPQDPAATLCRLISCCVKYIGGNNGPLSALSIPSKHVSFFTEYKEGIKLHYERYHIMYIHCKSEAFGKHFYQVYGTLQSALVPCSRNIIKKAQARYMSLIKFLA